MNYMHHIKAVASIPPAAILDNSSATVVEVDCTEADYATFIFELGATDIAMTALKIQSASSSGGSFSDISGATFDGGTDIDGSAVALPSATDDNQIAMIQIDLRGKDRYLQAVATFGDGTSGGYIAGSCILSRVDGPLRTSTDVCDGGVVRVA